jgi:glycosyltransferase involved in cell wall biosynthesis
MTQTRGHYSERNSPKVSVGLPVYNGEKYLRQTIESVLKQTWTDYELIISDNNSSDTTGIICEEYAKKDWRIKYLRSIELSPAPENFNKVLQEARGKYFIWVAADDVWDPRYIEELVRVLDTDQNCVGANGWVCFIDESGSSVRRPVLNEDWEHNSVYRRLESLASFQPGVNLYLYSLYRTVELQAIGVRCYRSHPFRVRFLEFPTLFAVAAKGKVRASPQARFYYRIHPDQDSHRHETFPMALFLEWRLLTSIVPSVRKGTGSLGEALFALCVAVRARAGLVLQFGFQKARDLVSSRGLGSA